MSNLSCTIMIRRSSILIYSKHGQIRTWDKKVPCRGFSDVQKFSGSSVKVFYIKLPLFLNIVQWKNGAGGGGGCLRPFCLSCPRVLLMAFTKMAQAWRKFDGSI